MTRSTHSTRLATVAAVAGALTIFVPVAQAEPILNINERGTDNPTLSQPGYGVDRVSDSVQAFQASQQGLDLSQSGYGTDRVSDSVQAFQASRQGRDLAQWGHGHSIESAQARNELGTSNMPDLVDRAVVAHKAEIASQSSPPDVLERAAAAGPDQYYFSPSSETGTGFDWGDFGIGAGAGIGLMLLLGTLGVGLHGTRRQVRTA